MYIHIYIYVCVWPFDLYNTRAWSSCGRWRKTISKLPHLRKVMEPVALSEDVEATGPVRGNLQPQTAAKAHGQRRRDMSLRSVGENGIDAGLLRECCHLLSLWT